MIGGGWPVNKKVVWLPYDMDTAIGINNEGALVFSYNLEDIDTVGGGSDVYNGQQSVLWKNLRATYFEEIKEMWKNLRSQDKISYAIVEGMFEEHQEKWPEAIFNEDAWFKYIDPLIEDGTASYLAMAQGSKAEKRKWWLYNRFRYIHSKYNAGDALTDVIQIRGYAKDDITVIPYADIYPAVKYGSYLVTARGQRNVETTLNCPLDNVNDTEIYIYSASQLKSVGDLSGFLVGFADFSNGTKLTSIKVGSDATGYENQNLTELYVGNNKLLQTVDARNCSALTQAVDLSGATNVENVYFGGTAITACSLPVGGILKVLELPATITNLTIRNQPSITSFSVEGSDYSNITTLRIENSSGVIPLFDILDEIAENSRVRLIGITFEADSTDDIDDFFDRLDAMRGLDENGNNLEHAVASGTISVNAASGEWLDEATTRYPNITINAAHTSTVLKYYNFDGSTLLESQTILDGADGTYTGTPARADDDNWRYTFIGWNTQPDKYVADANATKSVTRNRSVYAAYSRTSIAVLKYYKYDGSELLYSETIVGGGNGSYTGTPSRPADARYTYTFAGWATVANGQADANATKNVTTHRSVYAAYTAEGQKYTVTFKNEGGTTLQTVNNVLYGGTAQFTGTIPVKTGVDDPEEYEFIGWNPSNENIQGNTTCYPVYKYNGIKFYKILDKTIAGEYENSLVTEVRPYAFYACSKLEGINFPSATSIGKFAFDSCTALQSVSLPVATNIGAQAFQSCYALQSVSLPLAANIEPNAFCNCSTLQSVNLPAATDIGSYAFSNCYVLQSVNLPAVTSIMQNAFNYCTALQSVNLPATTAIGSYAFQCCYALQSASLPLAANINVQAFQSCYALQSINLPAATYIWSSAFISCCTLQSVSLPTVSYIWQSAFFNCYNLRAIFLSGSSVATLANTTVFFGTHKWLSIYVPDSLVTAYQTAANWSYYSGRIFGITSYSGLSDGITVTDVSGSYSNNTEVFYINDTSATSIEMSAFYNCTALQSISLPSTTIIKTNAFYNCFALQHISLPAATSIWASAFAGCIALQSVNLPAATSIGQNAFANCYAIQSISLPAVASIGQNAFVNCYALQTVNLSLVSYIGQSAFYSCHNLRAIFLSGSSVAALATTTVFFGTHKWLSIYVPDSLVTAYQTAANWSYYSGRIFGY